MAYTYDDFLSYLPMAGLTEQDFSPEDLRLAQQNPQAGVALLDAKFDWKNAQTDDERALANAKANQVRSQYGYSGGIDGMNGNVSLTPDDMPQSSQPQTGQGYATYSQQSQTSYPAFEFNRQAPTYQAPAAYDSQYTEQQQGIMNDMLNYKPFEYAPYSNQYNEQQQGLLNDMLNYGQFDFDPATSPLYSSYKKQYSREGNRAMQDTLGSLSAATGGRPSTAAMSAASQANDYHMSKLGDKLPQIYEQEYNKYLQDFNMMGQKLGAVNEMEGMDYSRYWDGKNFDYGRYLDDYNRMGTNLSALGTLDDREYGRYADNRDFGLDVHRTNLGQFNTDRDFDYGAYLDRYEMGRSEDQTAYDRATRESDTKWQRDTYTDETAYDREQSRLDREANERARADSRMLSIWQATGTASQEVADHFGIPVGTYYGGAETQLAIQQAEANIANTKARTANVGRTTGGTAPSDAQINAAYDRVRAGNGAGADFALLKEAGWTASELSALTGGGPDGPDGNAIDAAIDRLYGGTGTQNDIQTLIDAGYDTNDLKNEFPDMFTGDASPAQDDGWKRKYDPASMAKLNMPNLTENQLKEILDNPKYASWVGTDGLIYFERK